MRGIIRSTPYFNSSMQVVKEYGKAWADPARRGRVAAVSALVLGAKLAELIPFMLMASDDQKEKYKDLHADYLARYIILPHSNGIDLLRFRVPEQMMAISAPVNMALQNYMTDNDYSAQEMKGAALAWLPDQFDVTEPKRALLAWLPQIGRPSIEVVMNTKTWPEPRSLESQSQQRQLPKYRAYRSTSDMAKAIGEKTGMSPIKIDHLLQGYFGRSVKVFTRPGQELKKVTSPFLLESYFAAGRNVQDFYDLAEAITGKRTAIKGGKETVTPAEQRQLDRDYELTLSIKRGLKKYRELKSERTHEAQLLRAQIIDLIDSLGDSEAYKEFFPRESDGDSSLVTRPKIPRPVPAAQKSPR